MKNSIWEENELVKKDLPFFTLGRLIGTYTGWDHADTFSISIYDFKPLEGIDLPSKDFITLDFESGNAFWYDGEFESQDGLTWEENDVLRDEWAKTHYHEIDFVSRIAHLPNSVEKK